MNRYLLSLALIISFEILCPTLATCQGTEQLQVKIPTPGQFLMRQGIDTTDIEVVRSAFHTGDFPVNYHAARFLAERNHVEEIPSIRALFSTLDKYGVPGEKYGLVGLRLLNALVQLHDQDVKSLIYQYIDSIHANFRSRPALEYSALWGSSAVDLLLDMKDYSRYAFIVDVVDEGGLAGDIAVNTLQRFALDHDSPVRDEAYSKTLSLLNSSHSRKVQFTVLMTIANFPENAQTLPAISSAMNNPLDLVSDEAVEILMKDYFPQREVFDLLVARLYQVPSVYDYQRMRASDHLVKFPYPEVLRVMTDLATNAPNDTMRRKMGLQLWSYSPPRPGYGTLVAVMVDSIISYKHQVFALGWLGDKNFVNELDNGLENARKHLAKGDSVNTYKEVQKVQEKIQKEYDKTQESDKKKKGRDKRFVTTEGYKFLYYNAQYILDRLPDEKGKKKK